MKHIILAAALFASPAAAQDCKALQTEARAISEAMKASIALLTDAATIAAAGQLLGTDETARSFAAISQALLQSLNEHGTAGVHIKQMIRAAGC